MRNGKTTRKRILSLCMALSMVIGLIPFSAFAAGESLTVLTTYNATDATDYARQEITALTADNTNAITLHITAEHDGTSGNKIEIVIPAGLDLYQAPGVGDLAYNNDEKTYFDGDPTWTPSGAVSGVANDSGTLTYTLTASSPVSLDVQVKVNPAYVYTGSTSVVDHLLGTVSVNMTDAEGSTTYEEDKLAVSTTSLASDMKFTSLSAEETTPGSLNVSGNSPSEEDIMIDCSDTVTLSAVFSKNLSMSGANYTMRANSIYFNLTVPTGATVTPSISYTIDDEKTTNDVENSTTTYQFYNVGSDFTNSGDVGSIKFTDFATVNFDDGLDDGLYVAGEEHTITISDMTFHMDKYNGESFEDVEFTMESGVGTASTTVDVLAQSTDYNPGFSSSSGYTEEIQPDNATDRVLYSVRRGYMYGSTTTLDSYDPVTFTFEATPTGGGDTGFDEYLDNVSQVIMNVPFLGEAGTPRHIAQLTSLSITYEGDDTATSLTIPDLTRLYNGGAIGTYKEITTVGTDATGNVIAQYTWKTTTTPQITFTAPEGKSIINIEAVFSGDNNTYFSTSTYSQVIGLPKEDDSNGLYSKYEFAIYQDSSEVQRSDDGGFRWEQPQAFELTLSKITTNKNYMYNTAEENTIIIGNTSGSSGQNLYGYHNLGSASLTNSTGTALDDNETVTIAITANSYANDVVKEVYFPLYGSSDLSQVDDLTVTYTDGGTSNAYIASTDVENANYTLGVSTNPETFGIVQIPDGKTFSSLSVTLKTWGKDPTSGYVMLRGYVNNNDTLEVGDNYTVSVITTQTDDVEPAAVTLDNTLSAPSSTNGNVVILGAKTHTVTSGTFAGSQTTNVLSPGLSSQVEFDLMGGTAGNPYGGSWHDITFNVVLPAGIDLNTATAYDWRYQYNGSSSNFSAVSSTETPGDITFVKSELISSADAAAYYGIQASEVPDGAYIYTCTFDPDVNLYGMRFNSGNGVGTFTVSLDLAPTMTTSAVTVPWDKVLVLGSDASYTLNKATYGSYGEGISTTVDAIYNPGATSTVITGPSTKYLTVDSSAKLMLHDSFVKDSQGNKYTYTASDKDSIAIFGKNDTGSINFSVTNLVPAGTYDSAVNYVVFALPTTTATTALMEKNEFNITLTGDASITSSMSDAATVEVRYATMDTDGTLALASGETLFNSGEPYDAKVATANTLVLKITGQDNQETLSVSVPFQVPDTTNTNTEYAKIQGMSIYYYTASGTRTMYYSGASGDDTIGSADNFIYFGYSYPAWDIDYAGYTVDGDTKTAYTPSMPSGAITSVPDGDSLGTVANLDDIEGYTFIGWYTDEDLEDVYSSTSTIAKDTTLYAKFSAVSYSVNYAYESGYIETTLPATEVLSITGSLSLPEESEITVKDGYTFKGWYLSSDESKTLLSGNQTYSTLGFNDTTTTVTLVARCEAIDYTVKYSLGYDGATAIDDSTFTWGATYTLSTPTRNGYTLTGWYAEAGLTTAITSTGTYGTTDFTDDETETTTVYAKWTPNTYIIGYDLDSGAWADTAPANISVAWDGTITLPIQEPAKDGYTFAGWYYGATKIDTGDGYSRAIGVYEENADAAVADVNITAHWTEIANYTLEFDDQIADNGSNHTETLAWTDYVSLPTPPTQAGYTFNGWFTATTDGTEVTAATAYNTLTGAAADTAVVYAQWTTQAYTLSFDTDGDGDVDTTIQVTWDDDIAWPTDPTSTGATFQHWDLTLPDSTDHVATNKTMTFGDLVAANNGNTTITLTPHFTTNAHTIVLHTDVGTAPASFAIDADDPVTVADFNVDGYTFDGWYTAATDGTKLVNGTVFTTVFGSSVASNASVDLYARHTENIYNITFELKDVDGDTTADMPAGVNTSFGWSDTVTLPTPTKTGYTFNGWFENEDGKTGKVANGVYSTIYGADFATLTTTDYTYEGTLYAGWTAKSYEVDYYLNYTDASASDRPASSSLGWDATYTKPTNPTRTGYTFAGWGNATNSSTATVASDYADDKDYKEIFTDVAETKLYAIWAPVTYKVTYNTQDGTPAVTAETDVAYNATFTLDTTTVTKVGYAFDGWYTAATDGTKITQAVIDASNYGSLFGSANVTLYAQWTANDYDVKFLVDNAETTETGNWTEAITFADPTKSNYNFVGWYKTTDTTGETKITFQSETTTYKALFEAFGHNDTDTDQTVTLRAWWQEQTPTLITSDIIYSDEVLSNLVANADYIITVDGVAYQVTADGDGKIELVHDDIYHITNYDWLDNEISVVKKAVGTYTFDSNATTLTLDARPIAPTSTLDAGTYTGAQAFKLECEDNTVTIYYHIEERNTTGDGGADNYVLVDDMVYDASHTYSMKETSNLVIYSVNANGLKSEEVTYAYNIEPNLDATYEGIVTPTTPMIATIGGSSEDSRVSESQYQDFGLIRIDDEDDTDDDIVTNAERTYLNDAMPSGYSEDSAFQLHATVNDEVILDTVTLTSDATIVIDVPDMSSRKTYQVLHMKHGAGSSAEVEIFTENNADPNLALTVDRTAKTLTLSVDSLSPFMVVSKTTSSSSPSSSSTTAKLNTEDHFAYMQGFADGAFNPDANITRAQAIVMFSRLLTEQMDSGKTYTSSFSDVTSNMWYANAVGFMEQYGIINGYSDGTFRGDSPITRAQFAAIASRFDALDTTGELPFSDVDDSHWASDYISSASAKGWINGYTDGTFRPDQNITRAQAVTMVNRVLERSCDEDFVVKHLDDMITFTDVSISYWAYYNILEATNGHEYTITDDVETWTDLK